MMTFARWLVAMVLGTGAVSLLAAQEAHAQACTLSTAPDPLGALIPGASEQRLVLDVTEPGCKLYQLAAGADLQFRLRHGDGIEAALVALLEEPPKPETRIAVVLISRIPTGLPAGSYEIGIDHQGESSIATGNISVAEPILSERLLVEYPIASLDRMQGDDAGARKMTDGSALAVANGPALWQLHKREQLREEMRNTLRNIEHRLEQERSNLDKAKSKNDATGEKRSQDKIAELEREQYDVTTLLSGNSFAGVSNVALMRLPAPKACEGDCQRYWKVASSTWGTFVAYDDCVASDSPSSEEELNSCIIKDRQIRFHLFVPQRTPLRVTLKLEEARGTVKEIVTVPDIELAGGAIGKSIPLPIADPGVMSVKCGEDIRSNSKGGVFAIEHKELEDGECFVMLDFARSARWERLHLYGPQVIELAIQRGTSGRAISTVVPIDPLENEGRFSIPIPSPPGEGSLYELTVRVRAGSPEQGIASAGMATSPDETAEDISYVVRVKMREKSSYDWPGTRYSVRTYVTLPIELTGLRIPARPADLVASSQARTVELMLVKAGLLFAIEPWDHARNASWDFLSALSPRLLTGFHLIDISNGAFAPSFLAGMAISTPILGQPESITDTSVSVGVFYERDLSNMGGNHLLLTFGVNVFSLRPR